MLKKEEIKEKMATDALSNLLITRVCSVSTIYTPVKAKIKKPPRERWGIPIKYEGKTIYESNGKTFVSDANHIVILPRGCAYDWECTVPGHFCILEFESPCTYHEPISFTVKSSEKIHSVFKDLEAKRNRKNPFIELESIRDTYSVILTLISSREDEYMPSEKQKKIAPAVDYISQNYNQSLTNDYLAALCGMSTVYFRKLFTSLVGESPISYLHGIRIRKAKELLKTDYGSLTDLSQILGYPSLYDFSRDFKKRVGISPTKYAKN